MEQLYSIIRIALELLFENVEVLRSYNRKIKYSRNLEH
jgi:hypothetical protein